MNAVPISKTPAAAREYVQAGFVLVPIDRGSKGTKAKGWNLREKCIDTIEAASKLTGNIGVALAYSRMVVLDIDDMVLAVAWFAGAGIDLTGLWNALDAVRWTSGRINRGKILYRLPPGAPLLRTRSFKADGVELRCATANDRTVQDVLPPSIHPITGKPYTWLGPATYRDIPEVPADLLTFWIALTSRQVDDNSREPMGIGIDEIEETLAKIKAVTLEDYDDWLHVGMGLHHEFSGSDVGLELWHNWTLSDGKNPLYKGRADHETKWRSFREVENPRTMRTIVRLAEEQTDMSSEWEPIIDDPTSALRVEPVGLAALERPPVDPKIIIDSLMLEDACGFVAPGGTGKTTLAIYEAVHINLGRTLWGRTIVKPGKVLFISAEDSREVVESRLNRIVAALALNPAERATVADGFYIEDLSLVSARLVGIDSKGRIRTSKLLGEIIRRYASLKLSLVHLDPASLLGPGEQSGNDGMSELLRAARRISIQTQAACQIVHHVSQQVARGGIQDQYAGRGGTAFADNSRGQRQLVTVKKRLFIFDDRKYRLPVSVSDDALSDGEVLAILVHKLSYVKLNRHPIFIRRRGFSFEHIEAELLGSAGEASVDEDMEAVARFLDTELANDHRHSPNSVELHSKTIGLAMSRIRSLVKEGLAIGRFELAELSLAERRGSKTHYVITMDLENVDLSAR